MSARALLAPGLLLVSLALLASCPPPPPEVSDPCEGFSGVCLDLSRWAAAEGSAAAGVASVRQFAAGESMGGEAAQSKAGDWILSNDKIRVVVQGHDRHMGPHPHGGNIIDADLVRDRSQDDADAFGELGLLINFGRTLLPGEFKVFRDGSDGGAAVLAVAGTDDINDFINVKVLFKGFLGDLGNFWMEPDAPLNLNITQYYILNPGETRVQVVTALRNEGDGAAVFTTGDLIDRGGEIDFFLPDRATDARFGSAKLPLPEAANSFIGFAGRDVAYAYSLVGADGFEEDPNIALTVAGVTGTVIGAEDLFDFTGDAQPALLPPGAIELSKGETTVLRRDFFVGRDLADVDAARLALAGESLGEISGTVAPPAAGSIPPGTRVAAFGPGTSLPTTVFNVEGGAYTGRLPAGTWRLKLDAPGYPYSSEATVTVSGGAPQTQDFTVPTGAQLKVVVKDSAGAPSPAKVTLVCASACPKAGGTAAAAFRDANFDPFPADIQDIRFVGASGTATFPVPPGDYHVVISRGPEYSVHPASWPTRPAAQTLSAGQTTTVSATLAKVIDTAGWVSGDLHVHAINSPDSPVPNAERVLSFLAEGVDVIVSSDHDYVTDFAPYIQAAGAADYIASVVGDEVTTFEWGHFNTFPLTAQDEINGGAIDWGGGLGKTLTPTQLFEAMRQHPGAAEKVIQVNHGRGSLGYLSAIGVDTATGKTTTDPTLFRMEPPAATAGDTGLFDPSFTALEIINGLSGSNAPNAALNDWFAFLQRGFNPTATAVSDTHTRFNGGVGSPRTWVQVGAASEAPASFSPEGFATAINAGKAIGGNGPFISARAVAGAKSAGVGELLSLQSGATFGLEVTVQVPTWFSFDSIELYSNIGGTDARSGEAVSVLPTPTAKIAVDLSAETPVPGAHDPSNAAATDRRYLVTRTFDLSASGDAWYVIIVRGAGNAYPILLDPEVGAEAFTNPIYVDGDGDGKYTAPATFQKAARAPARVLEEGTPRRMKPEDLDRLLHEGAHLH